MTGKERLARCAERYDEIANAAFVRDAQPVCETEAKTAEIVGSGPAPTTNILIDRRGI